MIELLITYIFWILIYALEAKHDLNYITIDGTEKLWDAGMFAVLHIGFGVWAWEHFGFTLQGFWQGLTIGIIAVLVRVNFHDGFINVFRFEKDGTRKKWCEKFTVDNDKDYWDMLMVWIYNKGIKPCYIKISLLFLATAIYYVFFLGGKLWQ